MTKKKRKKEGFVTEVVPSEVANFMVNMFHQFGWAGISQEGPLPKSDFQASHALIPEESNDV